MRGARPEPHLNWVLVTTILASSLAFMTVRW